MLHPQLGEVLADSQECQLGKTVHIWESEAVGKRQDEQQQLHSMLQRYLHMGQRDGKNRAGEVNRWAHG